MWTCVVLLTLAGLSTGLGSAAPQAPTFSPGQDTHVSWQGLENDIVVYLPTDYDKSKAWPCVFFYHGMNGKPDTRLVRQYTGGRSFVVVGMEYVARGAVQLPQSEYRKILQQELDTYRDVRKWVTQHLSVDPKRVYVGGAGNQPLTRSSCVGPTSPPGGEVKGTLPRGCIRRSEVPLRSDRSTALRSLRSLRA